MPDVPANSRNPAPQDGAWLRALAGIDEGTLLDWVEGTLPPQAQADLAATHPNLVPLVSRMRRDRAVLASIESRAPAGLEERLTAALERDALLGLADGQPVSDALPISQVAKPKAPRPKWMASLPRLAMAAGLTLLVTGSALLIRRAGSGPAALPQENAKVATAPQPANAPVATGNADAAYASKDAEPAVAPAQDTASGAGPLILAEQTPDMDDARALALARDGRLVIRLREIGDDAVAKLASSARAGARPWHISRDLPESTLSLLAPTREPPQAERTSQPMALAGVASSGSPRPIPYAAPSYNARAELPAPSVVGFEVSVLADEGTLKLLRESLARTTGALVSFEESPAPFRKDGPRSAEAVLWWNQPPATWAPRAQIPLVVEQR